MNVRPAPPLAVDPTYTYMAQGEGRNRTIHSPFDAKRGDYAHYSDGWGLHPARVDYCGRLRLVWLSSTGIVGVGNPMPCKNLACPDCGPGQYDRLARHYLPLLAAQPEVYFAHATEDSESTRDHIRDRVTQRVRRSAWPVDYVRLPVEPGRHFVMATRPLRGTRQPRTWAEMTGLAAARLADRYLLPNGVESWPRASDDWYLPRRERVRASGDSTMFGAFTDPRIERATTNAFDDFEAVTGYRPVAGEPVRAEHVALLAALLAAQLGGDARTGLGDD